MLDVPDLVRDPLRDLVHAQLQFTLGSAMTLEREIGGDMSRVFLACDAALERSMRGSAAAW